VTLTYNRAKELCHNLDKPLSPPILRGLALNTLSRSSLKEAYGFGKQLLDLAHGTGDPVQYVEAHYVLGVTLFWQGEFLAARDHLARAVETYRPERSDTHIALFSQDPKVICLVRLGYTLWYLGFPDQARRTCQEALALAREINHPLSLAYAHIYVAWLANDCGELDNFETLSTELTSLLEREQLGFMKQNGAVLHGWLLFNRGESEDGIAYMYEGLEAVRESKQTLHLLYALVLMTRAYQRLGDRERALATLDEAFLFSEQTEERFLDAELHRIRGEMFAETGESTAAVQAFQQALDVARQQHAKALELRVAIRLASHWRILGQSEDAHRLLSESYHQFSEGFDTADLRRAKELLGERGENGGSAT
jgi:adenylate cyclase